jgi:NAD(P)H dehydrogenase (quinone)
MKKVLLVLAHPRRGSLTGQVADRFATSLAAAGHVVECADLVSEGFDPVLRVPDEPDWTNPDKMYSQAVLREMERIHRNDATVMIFPVWWWSMPAILKGWIDRVWNHGFAYGARTYPHRRVWLIGVAGNKHEDYIKRQYDRAMQTALFEGVLRYCGVADPRLEILYGAIEGPQFPPEILERAESLARSFSESETAGQGE